MFVELLWVEFWGLFLGPIRVQRKSAHTIPPCFPWMKSGASLCPPKWAPNQVGSGSIAGGVMTDSCAPHAPVLKAHALMFIMWFG